MAEIIIMQYDLLTLKVWLNTLEPEQPVNWELEGSKGGVRTPIKAWRCSAEEIGLPARLDRRQALYEGYDFRIPDGLVESLKESLREVDDQGRPLWLYLVKPYGYLGLVPWERLLHPKLQMPILRVPDFLVQPPPPKSTLDVILCNSMPASKASFNAEHYLRAMADRILKAVPRRTRLHVFTDMRVYGSLREYWNERGLLGNQIELHDPEGARRYDTPEATPQILDRSGRIQNPWLLWMRDALQGRSVDLVHFISHGYLSRDLGALALAESPLENQDEYMARFLGANELTTFLTQVGAWSSAFSSPEGNYSEMGLRLLADTVAQMRPGPVVHHELRLDKDFSALAGAYQFLYGTGPSTPPSSAALFMYCHPSLVAADLRESDAVASAELSNSLYSEEENVPAWVSAIDRYSEQCNLEIRKIARGTGDETSNSVQGAREREASVTQDTLKQIQDVMARMALSSKSREKQ